MVTVNSVAVHDPQEPQVVDLAKVPDHHVTVLVWLLHRGYVALSRPRCVLLNDLDWGLWVLLCHSQFGLKCQELFALHAFFSHLDCLLHADWLSHGDSTEKMVEFLLLIPGKILHRLQT
jgi:hypothetical protein